MLYHIDITAKYVYYVCFLTDMVNLKMRFTLIS